MPLFALANAGVVLTPSSIGEPVAWAVAASLAFGKPLGIVLCCALAVRVGVTRLPDGVSWGMVTGGACLAGIGFTMALFLNALAFPVDEFATQEAAGKIGTLAGSVMSAILGGVVLASALRDDRVAAANSDGAVYERGLTPRRSDRSRRRRPRNDHQAAPQRVGVGRQAPLGHWWGALGVRANGFTPLATAAGHGVGARAFPTSAPAPHGAEAAARRPSLGPT